eukprot:659425-Pyramimonas_sp.AAC.1
MWMLLSLHRCPRLVQAFGSASRCAVAHQGILAGCSHANAMMHMLLHRVVSKMCRLYVTAQPRILMDDSSFQWVGRRLCECDVLLAAARWHCHQ